MYLENKNDLALCIYYVTHNNLYIRQDIQERYETLEHKIALYLDDRNFVLLRKAFHYAYKYHAWEKSFSWSDRIVHLLETADRLADLSADYHSIVACLFLKLEKNNEHTSKDISKKFGKDIASIVAWVENISEYNIPDSTKALDLVFLKDFFEIAGKDIRVFLVKICERINTLERMDFVINEQTVSKAQETLNIYVPLIKILWIWKYIWNVEDLCYKYIDPAEYNRLDSLLEKQKDFLKNKQDTLYKDIKEALKKHTISASIESRLKTIYSINNKIKKKHIPLSGIFDLIAFRIIVKKKKEAYLVLGMIHSLYKSKDWRIKDYISSPKPNGYQSIHTTISDYEGYVFEIQIQTHQMHRFNMYGMASHNSYKGLPSDHKAFPKWMKDLLQQQKKWFDWQAIIESLSEWVLKDTIICMTPKWKEIELPRKSIILDFAFKLHTKIGEKVIWAYVNDEYIDNLRYTLQQWDTINLILSEKKVNYPVNYFSYLQTQSARKIFRKSLQNQSESQILSFGKVLINEKMSLSGYKPFDALPKVMRNSIQEKLGVKNSTELYLEIGRWNIEIDKLLVILYNNYNDGYKYKNKISIKITFKKKDYKNIQALFDLFHNLDIHLISVSYKGLKVDAQLHVDTLSQLHELIAEVSRLPNVYEVKRQFIARVLVFLILLFFVSVFIVLSPWIIFLIAERYSLSEAFYAIFFYINIWFFIAMLYFFKYIARVTLPWLIKRNIFWLGMFLLNTVILITVIWQSMYVFETGSSVFFISITLILYGLTTFEYLDSKWFDDNNF